MQATTMNEKLISKISVFFFLSALKLETVAVDSNLWCRLLLWHCIYMTMVNPWKCLFRFMWADRIFILTTLNLSPTLILLPNFALLSQLKIVIGCYLSTQNVPGLSLLQTLFWFKEVISKCSLFYWELILKCFWKRKTYKFSLFILSSFCFSIRIFM